MQAVECAVIAAAGMGSRLGHGLPKCMVEIGGKTVLSRLIATLRGCVDQIYVVVGYREELVIELCSKMHRDVIVVRNPNFRTTNTAQSNALAGRVCCGKTLFLDGDLVISKGSLERFIDFSKKYPMVAGITPIKSEKAVGVNLGTQPDGNRHVIESFAPDERTTYEWANVMAAPADIMTGATGYVYERLCDYLPIPACELDLREVDTEADLKEAVKFAEALDGDE